MLYKGKVGGTVLYKGKVGGTVLYKGKVGGADEMIGTAPCLILL